MGCFHIGDIRMLDTWKLFVLWFQLHSKLSKYSQGDVLLWICGFLGEKGCGLLSGGWDVGISYWRFLSVSLTQITSSFFLSKNTILLWLLIYISGLMAEHLYNFSFRRYGDLFLFLIHLLGLSFTFSANPTRYLKPNTAASVNTHIISCFQNWQTHFTLMQMI